VRELIPDPKKLRKEGLKDIIPVKDKITQILEGEKEEEDLLKNAVYKVGKDRSKKKKEDKVR
jgi:hypothetical protein